MTPFRLYEHSEAGRSHRRYFGSGATVAPAGASFGHSNETSTAPHKEDTAEHTTRKQWIQTLDSDKGEAEHRA